MPKDLFDSDVFSCGAKRKEWLISKCKMKQECNVSHAENKFFPYS